MDIHLTQRDKDLIERWKCKNGGAEFDFENDEVIFKEGLFHIEKGCITPKISIWFSEIDEVVNYFIRLRKMINRLGIKTNL